MEEEEDRDLGDRENLGEGTVDDGCPRRVVVDGGRENLGDTRDLLRDYRIQRTVISSYHPQTASLIERGHAPVVNALAMY